MDHADGVSYPATIPTIADEQGSQYIATAVLPSEGGDWKVETLDFERYQQHPRRKAGTITVRTVDSLIAYTKRQTEPGTIGFADSNGGIKVVINHHDAFELVAGDAGWRDHVVTLERERTTAYKAWIGRNEQPMKQTEFAEFLERRMGEIVAPNGADLLEVAKFFQSNTTVGFSSGRQLHNGQVQLHYVENIEEHGGAAGDVTVPTEFTLLLRPYKDSTVPAEGQPDPEQFVVGAKLRWRVERNAVTFWFSLGEELEAFMEGLHNAAIARVESETGVTVLRGAQV